jgi:hypothetical protein
MNLFERRVLALLDNFVSSELQMLDPSILIGQIPGGPSSPACKTASGLAASQRLCAALTLSRHCAQYWVQCWDMDWLLARQLRLGPERKL